ncbi:MULTISPECIES: MFS transporter [unclassified Streptomyces]|uniref:MFS transporter n=1 Tax=unclassified Streptomyces TaxID=2593676 RepID=UPI002E2E7CC5|nr:MFS transporter [Streptomyces sp. NBC_00223]
MTQDTPLSPPLPVPDGAGARRPAVRRRPPDLGLLTACQTLYQIAVSVDLTLTAIVGMRLAPTMALATLPLTLITVIGAVAAAAAGVLIPRFGYRAVMLAGSGAAVIGGCASAAAVHSRSFPLLCVGTSLVGLHKASGAYYRYLAADRAVPARRGRALATVLAGGVVAALAGPFLATESSMWFSTEFIGSYLVVSLASALVLPLIALLSATPGEPANSPARLRPPPAPLRPALGTVPFRRGLAALGYGGTVMTLLMATGPMGSQQAGHTVAQGAMVIQWHMVGMFAPSWFTGRLSTRFGPRAVALAGALVLVAGTAVGAAGTAMPLLMAALGLVGVGWNLLYVAGSGFVVQCYPQGRGSRIQSAVEGATACVSAAASLSAGYLFTRIGWSGANLAMLALSAFACLHFLRRTRA